MTTTRELEPRCEAIRLAAGERYQRFLDCGYWEFFCTTGLRFTPYLLQRAARRGRAKLFFVNVWVYPATDGRAVAYQYDAQFLSTITFDVTLHDSPELDPAGVERFFADVYERMHCQPYDDGD